MNSDLTRSSVANVRLLYKIIASGNQKRSTALVTNVDFEQWGEYLSDGPLAMAFLDRVVEGAIILKVKGKSYRAEKAKAQENLTA
jgi:DNA replication protein DnaC